MSEQDTPGRERPEKETVQEGEPDVAQEPVPEDEDAVPGRSAQPAGAHRALSLAVVLALAFAFFAASASGFLWWQYRQFYVALDQADAVSASSIQDVRASLRSVADRIEALEEADRRAADGVSELERRLEELPGRFVALEQRLSAVQGISDDARRGWLQAEAEYYLTAANTELALGGRWENAIAALELADMRLRELASPTFGGVRARIAEELQALRGVRLPDVEGLSYSLQRLAERAVTLPMGPVAPTRFAGDEQALEGAEPGLTRVWLSLKQAVAGMIRVERSDGPAYRALNADEQALVRRQLALELEMARLALLRAQTDVFQVSLTAARTLLAQEFEASDAAVESAIMLIEEMLRLDIDPARPDISGSLDLLRGLADRAG